MSEDRSELKDLADGVMTRLAYLKGAGVTRLPFTEGVVKDAPPTGTGCGACPMAGHLEPACGEGPASSRLMFVGAAAGGEDDFSGERGELLAKMIEAMGFKRDEVYLTLAVKCAPTGGLPEGAAEACRGELDREIESLGPGAIVAMGDLASNVLAGGAVHQTRGSFHTYRGVPVMPTYTPETLLRKKSLKKPAWDDLQKVMKRLAEG